MFNNSLKIELNYPSLFKNGEIYLSKDEKFLFGVSNSN
jgi:hypothetical protein